MKYHSITITIDDRIYEALSDAYDEKIEDYLENQLGVLFDQ